MKNESIYTTEQLQVLRDNTEAASETGLTERYDAELQAASAMWGQIVENETDRTLAFGFAPQVNMMERAQETPALIAFRKQSILSNHPVLGGKLEEFVTVVKIAPDGYTDLPWSETRVGKLGETSQDVTPSIGFTAEDVLFACARLTEEERVGIPLENV